MPLPPLLLLECQCGFLYIQSYGQEGDSLLEHKHLVRVDGVDIVVLDLADI